MVRYKNVIYRFSCATRCKIACFLRSLSVSLKGGSALCGSDLLWKCAIQTCPYISEQNSKKQTCIFLWSWPSQTSCFCYKQVNWLSGFWELKQQWIILIRCFFKNSPDLSSLSRHDCKGSKLMLHTPRTRTLAERSDSVFTKQNN